MHNTKLNHKHEKRAHHPSKWMNEQTAERDWRSDKKKRRKKQKNKCKPSLNDDAGTILVAIGNAMNCEIFFFSANKL